MVLLPEDIYDPVTPCMALDLGKLSAHSHLVEMKKGVDYRETKNIKELYNCYTFAFEGFSVKVIERMQGSYREILALKQLEWDDTHALLADFNFYFRAYDSVDKRNVLMPNNIVHLDFQDLDLLFTDKMLAAVFKIQNALMLKLRDSTLPPPDYVPPPKKQTKDTVDDLMKINNANRLQLEEDRKQLEELDKMTTALDTPATIVEEKKEEEAPKRERPLQEFRVTITKVTVNLADAYSEEEEQSAEYLYKKEHGLILPNACEPLCGVMEMSISGLELTVLMTSHSNMAVALCLHRFYILDC